MSLRHLLIASALDPSGGAGFLADTRIAVQVGVRPVGVVTAGTVQTTAGVSAVVPFDHEHLGAALLALLSDMEVHAVKVGMLGAPPIARALGEALNLTAAPVVWDPVLAPTRGSIPPDREALLLCREHLARHLTLVTPNLHELPALLGAPVAAEALTAGAAALAARWECAVLLKGGHASGNTEEAIDFLVRADGTHEVLRGPRIVGGEAVHGTGCALSTAIASHLARGAELVEACRAAKQLVADRIRTAVKPGRGAAAIV